MNPISVLHQAIKGLTYLHSLGIGKLFVFTGAVHYIFVGELLFISVHRDVKPRNVLLSFPSSSGVVRAMISDFGLCRKLGFGKASFTAKSGITGTEGWIAPEMFTNNTRVVSQ